MPKDAAQAPLVVAVPPPDAAFDGVQQHILHSAEGEPAIRIGVTHILAGAATDWLRHDVLEWAYVITGWLTVNTEGSSETVRSGESVTIPPGAWHSFENPKPAPASMLFVFASTAPRTDRRDFVAGGAVAPMSSRRTGADGRDE